MIVLKSVYNKEQIQYIAEQLSFAKKNKLNVSSINWWFEAESDSFPERIEISFKSELAKKD